MATSIFKFCSVMPLLLLPSTVSCGAWAAAVFYCSISSAKMDRRDKFSLFIICVVSLRMQSTGGFHNGYQKKDSAVQLSGKLFF
jgi:hypothetical protein